MKSKFQGSQKRPIRVTISQKGLGKKFQKIHLFDNQYPKVNGIVTLFTVTNFRPVSTSSTHVVSTLRCHYVLYVPRDTVKCPYVPWKSFIY